MKRLSTFLAYGSGVPVWLNYIEFRGTRAYMTTDGAGAYLVDPKTGDCEGVEGTHGCRLELCPSARRRLRQFAKVHEALQRGAVDADELGKQLERHRLLPVSNIYLTRGPR